MISPLAGIRELGKADGGEESRAVLPRLYLVERDKALSPVDIALFGFIRSNACPEAPDGLAQTA
jgi:hypothetical protein